MKRSKKSLYSEMVLLYRIDVSGEQGQKIQALCDEMGISIKFLSEEDLDSNVGKLAEMSILQESQTAKESETPSLPAMILRGFNGKRIDELFSKMKENGVGYIPLKAVITEVNRYWTLKLLLQNLASEREQLESAR